MKEQGILRPVNQEKGRRWVMIVIPGLWHPDTELTVEV